VGGAELSDAEADSSRALFEELDALLERMLSLPVSSAEESDSPDGPQAAPGPMPLITIAEAMLEPSPPPRRPTSPSPPPPAYSAPLPPVTATDEAFAAQAGVGFTPPAPPVPQPSPVPPLPQAPPTKTMSLPSPDPVPAKPVAATEPSATFVPPPPLWLLPLVWCNRAFDVCTTPLGPLGRWLRGARGRAALGWAGLVLLVAAGGLFLNGWFGWTW
jgi:hypothetical protein